MFPIYTYVRSYLFATPESIWRHKAITATFAILINGCQPDELRGFLWWPPTECTLQNVIYMLSLWFMCSYISIFRSTLTKPFINCCEYYTTTMCRYPHPFRVKWHLLKRRIPNHITQYISGRACHLGQKFITPERWSHHPHQGVRGHLDE